VDQSEVKGMKSEVVVEDDPVWVAVILNETVEVLVKVTTSVSVTRPGQMVTIDPRVTVMMTGVAVPKVVVPFKVKVTGICDEFVEVRWLDPEVKAALELYPMEVCVSFEVTTDDLVLVTTTTESDELPESPSLEVGTSVVGSELVTRVMVDQSSVVTVAPDVMVIVVTTETEVMVEFPAELVAGIDVDDEETVREPLEAEPVRVESSTEVWDSVDRVLDADCKDVETVGSVTVRLWYVPVKVERGWLGQTLKDSDQWENVGEAPGLVVLAVLLRPEVDDTLEMPESVEELSLSVSVCVVMVTTSVADSVIDSVTVVSSVKVTLELGVSVGIVVDTEVAENEEPLSVAVPEDAVVEPSPETDSEVMVVSQGVTVIEMVERKDDPVPVWERVRLLPAAVEKVDSASDVEPAKEEDSSDWTVWLLEVSVFETDSVTLETGTSVVEIGASVEAPSATHG
jgi:hypothetical protein